MFSFLTCGVDLISMKLYLICENEVFFIMYVIAILLFTQSMNEMYHD